MPDEKLKAAPDSTMWAQPPGGHSLEALAAGSCSRRAGRAIAAAPKASSATLGMTKSTLVSNLTFVRTGSPPAQRVPGGHRLNPSGTAAPSRAHRAEARAPVCSNTNAPAMTRTLIAAGTRIACAYPGCASEHTAGASIIRLQRSCQYLPAAYNDSSAADGPTVDDMRSGAKGASVCFAA